MPKDDGDPTNVRVLDGARRKLGWSLDRLWMSYFELGGKAGPLEFEAFFHGLMVPDPYQYDVIAHALNEAFSERGQDHPVPYADPARGVSA